MPLILVKRNTKLTLAKKYILDISATTVAFFSKDNKRQLQNCMWMVVVKTESIERTY